MDLNDTQALECSLDDETEDESVCNASESLVATLAVKDPLDGNGNVAFSVFNGINKVGSGADCEICIHSEFISKHHCTIEYTSGTHLVFDCGSRNKTKKNKLFLIPKVRYELRNGDTLKFGNIVCEYKFSGRNQLSNSETKKTFVNLGEPVACKSSWDNLLGMQLNNEDSDVNETVDDCENESTLSKDLLMKCNNGMAILDYSSDEEGQVMEVLDDINLENEKDRIITNKSGTEFCVNSPAEKKSDVLMTFSGEMQNTEMNTENDIKMNVDSSISIPKFLSGPKLLVEDSPEANLVQHVNTGKCVNAIPQSGTQAEPHLTPIKSNFISKFNVVFDTPIFNETQNVDGSRNECLKHNESANPHFAAETQDILDDISSHHLRRKIFAASVSSSLSITEIPETPEKDQFESHTPVAQATNLKLVTALDGSLCKSNTDDSMSAYKVELKKKLFANESHCVDEDYHISKPISEATQKNNQVTQLVNSILELVSDSCGSIASASEERVENILMSLTSGTIVQSDLQEVTKENAIVLHDENVGGDGCNLSKSDEDKHMSETGELIFRKIEREDDEYVEHKDCNRIAKGDSEESLSSGNTNFKLLHDITDSKIAKEIHGQPQEIVATKSLGSRIINEFSKDVLIEQPSYDHRESPHEDPTAAIFPKSYAHRDCLTQKVKSDEKPKKNSIRKLGADKRKHKTDSPRLTNSKSNVSNKLLKKSKTGLRKKLFGSLGDEFELSYSDNLYDSSSQKRCAREEMIRAEASNTKDLPNILAESLSNSLFKKKLKGDGKVSRKKIFKLKSDRMKMDINVDFNKNREAESMPLEMLFKCDNEDIQTNRRVSMRNNKGKKPLKPDFLELNSQNIPVDDHHKNEEFRTSDKIKMKDGNYILSTKTQNEESYLIWCKNDSTNDFMLEGTGLLTAQGRPNCHAFAVGHDNLTADLSNPSGVKKSKDRKVSKIGFSQNGLHKIEGEISKINKDFKVLQPSHAFEGSEDDLKKIQADENDCFNHEIINDFIKPQPDLVSKGLVRVQGKNRSNNIRNHDCVAVDKFGTLSKKLKIEVFGDCQRNTDSQESENVLQDSKARIRRNNKRRKHSNDDDVNNDYGSNDKSRRLSETIRKNKFLEEKEEGISNDFEASEVSIKYTSRSGSISQIKEKTLTTTSEKGIMHDSSMLDNVGDNVSDYKVLRSCKVRKRKMLSLEIIEEKQLKDTSGDDFLSKKGVKSTRKSEVNKSTTEPKRASTFPNTLDGTIGKPKVMFTGVREEDALETLMKLGGEEAESILECTHVVSNQVRRTIKFMCAMARGIPIVSMDWLRESKKEEKFVDAWQYLVKDANSEAKFKFNLEESLCCSASAKLFEGFNFYITKNVKPEPYEMKEIINCAGGRVSNTMPKKFTDNLIVISCLDDSKFWENLKVLGIPIVSTEFVMTGILRHVLDTQEFILSHPSPENNVESSMMQRMVSCRKKR